MPGVNECILVGNLGADPELKSTNSGTSVCNFSIATSRQWTTKDGEKKEDTQWHKIVVWGRMGENCKEYLAKGRQVYIRGRIQTRDWEDKEGVKRYITEIHAIDVQFLGGKSGGGGGSRSEAAPSLGDDDIPF